MYPLEAEFVDDPMGRAFRDLHALADLAQPHARVVRHAHQNLSVIRQELPFRGRLGHDHVIITILDF